MSQTTVQGTSNSIEVDNELADGVRGMGLGRAPQAGGTVADAGTPGIVVKNEKDEVVTTAPPSSKELLARVLGERKHLDLTDKVFVEKNAVRARHGGAADVFEGHIINTNMKVAVKRLRLNILGDEKIAKNIAKEIRIWSDFRHPNVLPLLGYQMEGGYPSLISEWVERGSLREYMHHIGRKESIVMMLGVARGLKYIHSSKDAIHSDVKSDNILVSPEGTALLTDFGISRMDALSAGYTTRSVGGSTRWQAFELLDIKNDGSPAPTHTKMTDVWAFGMTVYELLTHEVPYHNVNDHTQVVLTLARGWTPIWDTKAPDLPRHEPLDKEVDDFMWAICQKCWFKHEERPTMPTLVDEIQDYAVTIGVAMAMADSKS